MPVIPTKKGVLHPRRDGVKLIINGQEISIVEEDDLIEIQVLADGAFHSQSYLSAAQVIEAFNNCHIYFKNFPLDRSEVHPSIKCDKNNSSWEVFLEEMEPIKAQIQKLADHYGIKKGVSLTWRDGKVGVALNIDEF